MEAWALAAASLRIQSPQKSACVKDQMGVVEALGVGAEIAVLHLHLHHRGPLQPIVESVRDLVVDHCHVADVREGRVAAGEAEDLADGFRRQRHLAVVADW